MNKAIVVTGAGAGLGLAIKEEIEAAWGFTVYNLDIDPGPGEKMIAEGGTWYCCDVSILQSARAAAEAVKKDMIQNDSILHAVINNAGVNEIGFIEDLSSADWDHVMGVNAKGIFLVSQAFLPMLIDSGGTILNITSNAAWVPMTSSLVYNASKAAAHMMTIQMAHEFHRRQIPVTVFAVAPGKLKGTQMSEYIESRVLETRGWTPEFAREYQLASLRSGAETRPVQLAGYIAFLLSHKSRHSQLAGCVLPYGA